jgi:hypothetical protein
MDVKIYQSISDVEGVVHDIRKITIVDNRVRLIISGKPDSNFVEAPYGFCIHASSILVNTYNSGLVEMLDIS